MSMLAVIAAFLASVPALPSGAMAPGPQGAEKKPAAVLAPVRNEAPKEARVGDTVEDFTLRVVAEPKRDAAIEKSQKGQRSLKAGEEFSLLRYKGEKPLVLAFFGQACSHTKKYAKQVAELAERFQESAVFVGVRCNADDDPAALRALMTRLKLAMPLLDDADGRLTRYFRVRVAPTFIIIDPDGVMRYFGGFDDAGHAEPVPVTPLLPSALNSVVEGETVRVQRSVPTGCAVRPVTAH